MLVNIDLKGSDAGYLCIEWDDIVNLKDIYKDFLHIKDDVKDVFLPERGFAIVNDEKVIFDKEYHYENLQDIVKIVCPQEYLSVCKKCGDDQIKYINYLMKKNVMVFLNYGIVHLNEYKVYPSLIYDSFGFFFFFKALNNISEKEQEYLLKYMDDFKRMASLDIKFTYFNEDNKLVKKSCGLDYLEQYLSCVQDQVKSL